MKVFDWDALRAETEPGFPGYKPQRTRDAVILKAFNQYADGNDYFESLDSVELNNNYDIFRNAWIIADLVNAPGVRKEKDDGKEAQEGKD